MSIYGHPQMQNDSDLRRVQSFPYCTIEEICGSSGPILVMAPHPDDETLGCGGLMAEARQRKREVYIAVLTDGTQSHPNSKAYPSERLGELRRSESRAAAVELGLDPERIVFLGLQDGGVPHAGSIFNNAVARIADLCLARNVSALFCTWRHDPHPDHKAAWSMALEVQQRIPSLKLWAYPIWGWTLDHTDAAGAGATNGVRLNISGHLPAKRRAISGHASQISGLIHDDSQGFRLSAEVISFFEQSFEVFLNDDRD